MMDLGVAVCKGECNAEIVACSRPINHFSRLSHRKRECVVDRILVLIDKNPQFHWLPVCRIAESSVGSPRIIRCSMSSALQPRSNHRAIWRIGLGANGLVHRNTPVVCSLVGGTFINEDRSGYIRRELRRGGISQNRHVGRLDRIRHISTNPNVGTFEIRIRRKPAIGTIGV